MLKLLPNNSKNSTKNYGLIKKNLYCYKILKSRLIKTKINVISKFLIIEFNIKSEFYIIQKIKPLIKNSHLLNLYLTDKKNIYNFIDNFFSKKLDKLFFVLFFFKQTFLLKNFVKGRVLNFFKNGFVIVQNGFLCFLPTSNCLHINFFLGKLNIFFISFFNEKENKTIVLSQKNIYKKLHFTLLKMASRILFKNKRQS